MFNSLKEAVDYIENQRVKRSLDDFKQTIKKYNYKTDYPIIHVAGTNGKGSTVKYIEELLFTKGYNVATFTSPYIINHNDRIQYNGKSISDLDLFMIINQLQKIIETEHLSMFEIDILIFLEFIKDKHFDYLVIECGIGGLNDKTNIFDSIISVITNVGYDHQFMLRDTLEEIAFQKVGILSKNSILITTETNKEIIKLFARECEKKHSLLKKVKAPTITNYPYTFNYNSHNYKLNTLGSYQVSNALLAISVVSHLTNLNSIEIQQALDSFKEPGRMELVDGIYLDGAHNVNAIEALKKSINDLKMDDVGIVFSSLVDKDKDSMLKSLSKYDLIEASFNDDRSKIKAIDYKDAIQEMKVKHKNVIVTGSLHFVSTVRKYLISNNA
ncbi:MAG: Mur ligase family protein [Thomasclavelia sp.]|nr:Mur ligase family protein [Thomasclavelia sp.]